MRITCTNCEAEYEVPDSAIPRLGREVQCSNCGHTWFVNPRPLVEMHVAPPSQDTAPATPDPQPAAPQQDSVSEKAKAVLQEEAARELEARQAEADLHTQPDLGLESAANINDHGAAPAKQQVTEFKDLPDIDDIDQDLTAATKEKVKKQKAKPASVPKKKGRRKGFRRGFITAVLILGAMVGIYAFAPQISDVQPNFADEINSYVLWVNDLRQKLFMWADDLIASLENMGPQTPTNQN